MKPSTQGHKYKGDVILGGFLFWIAVIILVVLIL